jgi:hypothetical protein
MRKEENAYQSWLWGEVLLFGLLGALLALFVTYPGLRPSFDLPRVRLVLNTMVALAAVLVAVLAGVRFSASRWRRARRSSSESPPHSETRRCTGANNGP